METGAPGTRRPLPKGESGRQARPQRKGSSRGSRRAFVPRRSVPRERRSPTKSGSTSNLSCHTSRPRDGGTTTTVGCWAASCGWRAPAPPGGRCPRNSASGDRLPALRAVGKAGPLAAHPRSIGRGRITGTGDQGALNDAVGKNQPVEKRTRRSTRTALPLAWPPVPSRRRPQ
jgi:hypothetical protein